jgi:hypothetical protein
MSFSPGRLQQMFPTRTPTDMPSIDKLPLFYSNFQDSYLFYLQSDSDVNLPLSSWAEDPGCYWPNTGVGPPCKSGQDTMADGFYCRLILLLLLAVLLAVAFVG